MSISLAEYIKKATGGGSSSFFRLLSRMFIGSFTATSFTGFWRRWNPLYGYFLAKYSYRPLRRVFGRSLSVIFTFALSGFLLHDLPFIWIPSLFITGMVPPPYVAVWFFLMGFVLVISESIGVNFRKSPRYLRAFYILSHLTGASIIAVAVIYYWTVLLRCCNKV